MAGVAFTVAVDFSKVKQRFENIAANTQDATDLFADIGMALQSSTIGRLNAGLKPDGSHQKPVKRGGTPLVNTGVNLRDTITFSASPDSVEVGSNSVIAAIHQFGGQAGRNHE